MSLATSSSPTDEGLEDLRRAWVERLQDEGEAAVQLRHQLHRSPCLSGAEEPAASTLERELGIPLERVAETGRIGRLGPCVGPTGTAGPTRGRSRGGQPPLRRGLAGPRRAEPPTTPGGSSCSRWWVASP